MLPYSAILTGPGAKAFAGDAHRGKYPAALRNSRISARKPKVSTLTPTENCSNSISQTTSPACASQITKAKHDKHNTHDSQTRQPRTTAKQDNHESQPRHARQTGTPRTTAKHDRQARQSRQSSTTRTTHRHDNHDRKARQPR